MQEWTFFIFWPSTFVPFTFFTLLPFWHFGTDLRWPSNFTSSRWESACEISRPKVSLHISRDTQTHPADCFTRTTHTRPFSGTTQVSRHQKGKTNLDFTETRDSDWQWHQLGHMQVCTSLQTDNHASTPSLSFTGRMPFLPPNLLRQSTSVVVNQWRRDKASVLLLTLCYNSITWAVNVAFGDVGLHRAIGPLQIGCQLCIITATLLFEFVTIWWMLLRACCDMVTGG